MKVLPCPDCGRTLRPCNMQRHRRTHLPKAKTDRYGKKYVVPKQPIRLGRSKDRRYDEIAPRGEGGERYRIYRLRAGDLQLLATAGDPQGVGLGLVTLWEEGEFDGGDDSLGILDTATDPGHWIANPWALGRRAE